MDREKFDQHLMDYLFDELDEVTRAAMKRKLEADAECRDVEARMRATLTVAQQLPMAEPSEDLEERILAAAAAAERGEPWHRKLLRSLSWAGSHAMRPQLAMAALLMLVLGSSVLLLRARPGAMRVSSEGVPSGVQKDPAAHAAEAPTAEPTPPASDDKRVADAKPTRENRPAPEAAAPEATAPEAAASAPDDAKDGDGKDDDATYARALKSFRAGNDAEAQKDFGAVAAGKSKNAGSAALYQARSVRRASGCKEAVGYYDRVRQKSGAVGIGADATFEEADCYTQLGDRGHARQLLLSLADSPEYHARAAEELERAGEAASTGGTAVAAPKKAAAPPAAKASKPAAQPSDSAL